MWRKPAENVNQYCSKGSLVGVEGRIQTRSYDNSQGQKVNVVEVICDSVQFLETKPKEEPKNKYDVKDPRFDDLKQNQYDIMEDDLQF